MPGVNPGVKPGESLAPVPTCAIRRGGKSGPTLFRGIWDFAASSAGIPEPASWAMLIAGFGLVGSALRRRNTLRAARDRSRRTL